MLKYKIVPKGDGLFEWQCLDGDRVVTTSGKEVLHSRDEAEQSRDRYCEAMHRRRGIKRRIEGRRIT